MDKIRKELFLFLLGFLLGFGGSIICYYYQEDFFQYAILKIERYIELLSEKTGIGFLIYIPLWAYALFLSIILLILGLIITQVIRLFVNTKNIKVLSVILSMINTVIIVIPFTAIAIVFFNGSMLSFPSSLTFAMTGIGYAIIFRMVGYALNVSYVKYLEKPKKNFSVILCEADSYNTYAEIQVLAKHMTYEHAYNYIRNNVRELEIRQFYMIVEKSIFGLIRVAHWNYFRDGHPMNTTEEQFLSLIYNADHSKLRIRPKEDNDE